MLNKIINAWRSSPALPSYIPPSEGNPVVASLSMQGKSLTLTKQPAPRRNVRFFTAAGSARNQSTWATQDTAINALLQTQLYILRARSRNLTRNTSPGKRFITLSKNNIIGPDGIRVQSRCGETQIVDGQAKWVLDTMANDAIETHYKIWCEAEHCDVTGQQNFEEMCRMMVANLGQDGEILVKEIIGTKATPYRYQLQMLAIDRLDIHKNGTAENGNQIRMGVEINTAGKPVAYYVLLRNPNDSLSLGMQKHDRIAYDEIIHRFVKCDAEQIRGFPWTHAVMNGERLLGMMQDATLEASVVGATSMGWFVPTAPGDVGYIPPSDDEDPAAGVADGQDPNGDYVMDAVGASFRIMPEGMADLKQFDPKYPQAAYSPFVKEIKMDLASGLDVANHNLSGDMTGVNYSSARIAELQERDTWRGFQKWFINHVMKHVVGKRWLKLSLLAGAIKLENGVPLPATKVDKYLAGLEYVARGWDWVDPKNEIVAATAAINEGLTTRSKVVASKGGDFEENIIELAREEELIRLHKVKIGQQPKTTQAEPAQQSEDANAN